MTRPLIFWGVDTHAAGIVRQFVRSLRHDSAVSDSHNIFDPQGEEPLPEFKENILKFRDRTKMKRLAGEPGVVLFMSAFDTKGRAGLEFLKGVGQIVERALPGDQAITLVVLFPHATIEKKKKLEAFKFFLRLEEIVWDIPFLKTIYVNQFSSQLYEQEISDDEAPDSESSEKNKLNPLIEFIHRELVDDDLIDLIQGIGHAVIGNQNSVLGQKCCYATAGVYKLIYFHKECLKYLKTRLQYDLFNHSLYDIESIRKKKKRLSKIQDRADEFIKTQAENITPSIPMPKTVSLAEPNEWFDLETLDRRFSKFEDDLSSETLRVKTECHKKLMSIEEVMKREFVDFLDTDGKYYAEPGMYADALMGTRLFSDAEKHVEMPSGIDLFKMFVCVDPYIDTWVLFFEPHLESAFVKLGLALAERFDTDSTFSWLLRSIQLAESRIKEITPDSEFDLYFLFQFIDITLSHLRKNVFNLESATNLTHEMISRAGQGFHELQSIMQRNRNRRADAEEEGKRIRKTYGFLQRIFSKSSRDEFHRLENQRKGLIKSLDTEYQFLVQARQNVWGLLIDAINRVVLPNNIRSIFCQAFMEETRDVCQKYYDFIGKIKTSVDDQWTLGSQITQFREPTAATILNKDRLDRLYEGVLKGKKLQELAEELFIFVPPHLMESELEELSYYDCENPKDHYLSGSNTLIDRMTDFSIELCKPVETMDILDVISIEGKEKAHEYLKDNVENAKKFLDFSEGLLPLIEQHRMMNSVLVMRSADCVNKKLASNHAFIFGADAHFFDSNNPYKIDITYLVFGFPAFLIHGLAECRDIFRASEGKESIDLWPSSML